MGIQKIDRDLITLIAFVVIATFGTAIALSRGVLSWGDVIPSYLPDGLSGTLVVVLARCMYEAWRTRGSPFAELRSILRDKTLCCWLTVPAVMAPIFLAGFTVLKTLIAIKIGFTWDRAFTDLDAAIFETDPWRLSHAILGGRATYALEFSYVWWGVVLFFSMPLVTLLASRDHAATFLLSMFLTWAIAGLCFAAAFASAGPCFAYLFDPELGARFEPLRDQLSHSLGDGDLIAMTQQYLAQHWDARTVVEDGGISAFPSVHVAVAVIYVAATRHKPVLMAFAILFAALIWIGSVHFGYHYAVDGIAGGAIALVCWYASSRVVAAVAALRPNMAMPSTDMPARSG